MTKAGMINNWSAANYFAKQFGRRLTSPCDAWIHLDALFEGSSSVHVQLFVSVNREHASYAKARVADFPF